MKFLFLAFLNEKMPEASMTCRFFSLLLQQSFRMTEIFLKKDSFCGNDDVLNLKAKDLC